MSPHKIYVEYDERIRDAVKSVYPAAELMGSYAHRVKLLFDSCKSMKCSLLGIKTAAVSKTIHMFIAYVLVISIKPEDEFVRDWTLLKTKIDNSVFGPVIELIEKEFLAPQGKYHSELTYHAHLAEKAFRISTPAIEGYHYRLKHLIKTYSVVSMDMLMDKVLTAEEKHFSSKVAEVNIGRIISPEQPEKFFFERSMGTLPISTAVADIYGLYTVVDPWTLAEALCEGNESRVLPQRKCLVSLWQLDEYKNNLVSFNSVSSVILSKYIERKAQYKAVKAELSAKNGNGAEE